MLDLKYKTILSVALPLMVSSFIQSIVLLTDTAFLSRYSTVAFDAAGNGGLIYVTMYMALAGMGDGAQILIARRIGQKNGAAVGRIFGTSILTNFAIAFLLFLFLQLLMPDILTGYSKDKNLAMEQNHFISIRSYALFFAMISLSIQAFFFATGKTWIVLISAVITACSNVILDYLLIFGKFSFPEMGLEGAALASTLADGLGMLFLVSYLIFSKLRKEYALFAHFSFNLNSFKELIRVGSPVMFQGIVALSTWTIFFIWIEQMGQFELTVSQNIRAIYFLALIPIWGFSATTKTYISQYIGKGDFASLKVIQKRIQFLTMLFLSVIVILCAFLPEDLISMINPSKAYIAKSAEILRLISVSTLLFGFISVYFQTINGSVYTMATFGIEVICVIVYLAFSYFLIKILKLDIYWIWTVEYVYFGMMGILSISYLKIFDWKKKVV